MATAMKVPSRLLLTVGPRGMGGPGAGVSEIAFTLNSGKLMKKACSGTVSPRCRHRATVAWTQYLTVVLRFPGLILMILILLTPLIICLMLPTALCVIWVMVNMLR